MTAKIGIDGNAERGRLSDWVLGSKRIIVPNLQRKRVLDLQGIV